MHLEKYSTVVSKMHNNRNMLFFYWNRLITLNVLLQLEVVKDIYLYESPITWISSYFFIYNDYHLSLNHQFNIGIVYCCRALYPIVF